MNNNNNGCVIGENEGIQKKEGFLLKGYSEERETFLSSVTFLSSGDPQISFVQYYHDKVIWSVVI